MDVEEARIKTYYEILGVPLDATPQQIREMYKDLARLYHPDSNYYADLVREPPSPEQVELFKIITSAYQTLIDPTKRIEYDEKVKPLLTGSFQKWEDSSEDFFENRAPTRERKNTFGVTDHEPFSREELMKTMQSPRVTQIIKIQKRRPKIIKLVALAVIVTVGILVAVVQLPGRGAPAKPSAPHYYR